MSQTLYLIDESYFEGSSDLIKVWSKAINEECTNEKANLVYDPMCNNLFNAMISNENELVTLVTAYYSYFEDHYSAQLSWGELDMKSVQYIDNLMELLYNLNWEHRALSAYGCFPLQYDKVTMHLFFFITPGLDEDKFYLISEKDFIKNYELIVRTEEMFFG